MSLSSPVTNPIVTCPYDRTHRIRRSVLPFHLVRCGRNHSKSGKVQCPFDAFHVVDEQYFKKHLENCASSGNIKRLQYCFESSEPVGTVPLEAVKNLQHVAMREWKEENFKTYDPWECTEGKKIIRNLIGVTRSQRKKFKVMERERMSNFEDRDMLRPNLARNFNEMHRTINRRPNISMLQLIQNLERMSLDEIDSILGTNVIKNGCREYMTNNMSLTQIVEEVLVKRFRELIVQHLKSENY